MHNKKLCAYIIIIIELFIESEIPGMQYKLIYLIFINID